MKDKKLDEIYKLHMKDVYYYILSLCNDSYLAEDIVQETFYRAYLYLEDCHDDKIKPWLFRVAHNTFIDFYRKHNKNVITEDSFFNCISDTKTPEGELLKNEKMREIFNIISSMPINQKQAILLCDFNGLSYKEAAEIIGVSAAYLKVILFRAREKLRVKGKGDNNE